MNRTELDVLVVGAGFAGLFALQRLRALGLAVRVIEAGPGIGGTWYWNRYPGARCDIESLEYCYQFSHELAQEWQWSERYASQPEILRYLTHFADRFELFRDIELESRVESAHFRESEQRWHVGVAGGERLSARWLVMATGCLSRPNKPVFPGLEQFARPVYHTAEWPHEQISFHGKRVGVIGTGSSAVQAIPVIAQQAAHLFVFQRTATYSVPAHNGPLDAGLQQRVKADYAAFRANGNAQFSGANFSANEVRACDVSAAERERTYDERWARGGLSFTASFADLMSSPESNDTAGDYLRRKIHDIVKDPSVAQTLSPRHTFACKRLCVDTGYYDTFNQRNVTLVDVCAHPIQRLTHSGLETAAGSYELDCLVFATGFDAMTGALMAIDIRGRNRLTLKDAWSAGPRTYLGLATAGFPNLFIVSGPGSPSVLSNMVAAIEQDVNWIAQCIGEMERRAVGMLEATARAQDAWVEHANAVADLTLYPRCNSWYLGANVPGKPRVFMPYSGGFPDYTRRCNEVAAAGYRGFEQRARGARR